MFSLINLTELLMYFALLYLEMPLVTNKFIFIFVCLDTVTYLVEFEFYLYHIFILKKKSAGYFR